VEASTRVSREATCRELAKQDGPNYVQWNPTGKSRDSFIIQVEAGRVGDESHQGSGIFSRGAIEEK